MGWLFRKDPFMCEMLERYRINIEKTNQKFLANRTAVGQFDKREYCELLAENEKYLFYSYMTYSDGSGGYVLRREKKNPRKIVFFGSCKIFNRIFHGHLFQVDATGWSGFGGEQFGITARNIETGTKTCFNWLSEVCVVIEGHTGHVPYQDSVKNVYVQDDYLIFEVTRQKSGRNWSDEYDRDMNYELVVEFISGRFEATAIFPPLDIDDDNP